MANTPQPKKRRTIWITLLIIAAALIVSAASIYAIGALLQVAGKALNPNAEGYSQRFAALEAAPKDFTASEPAQIGPYDITVTNVQPEYTPSAAEQSVIDALRKSMALRKNPSDSPAASKGLMIPDASASYLKVSLTARTNQEREALYARLTLSGTIDWIQSLALARVQDYRPILVQPGGLEDLFRPPETKTAEGLPITLLYRIDKTVGNTTLEYTQSVYSRTSAIVGTEGMPSKSFTYTIRL